MPRERLLPPHLAPQITKEGRIPSGGFTRVGPKGVETGGRYISPSEAFWNSIGWKLPLGPLLADKPTTGSWGTDPGKQLLSEVPFIGQPIAAAKYAQENPYQWNPAMSGGERAWETAKNVLGYGGYAGGPAGKAMDYASKGISVAEGAGKFFDTDYMNQIRSAMRGPDAGQADRVAKLWDDDENLRGQPTRAPSRPGEPTVAGIPTSFNEPSAPAPTDTQTDPGPAPTSAPAPDMFTVTYGDVANRLFVPGSGWWSPVTTSSGQSGYFYGQYPAGTTQEMLQADINNMLSTDPMSQTVQSP